MQEVSKETMKNNNMLECSLKKDLKIASALVIFSSYIAKFLTQKSSLNKLTKANCGGSLYVKKGF
jgi:hypothetical protein